MRTYPKTEVSTCIQVEGIEKEIELSTEVEWVDNGIGAFEYWGYKANHVQIEPEITGEVIWDMTLYSTLENLKIQKYVEENFNTLEEELLTKAEDIGYDHDESAEPFARD